MLFNKISKKYIKEIISYTNNYYYDDIYKITITHTFILNNYRIIFLFYKKYICVIAKDIYNYIYTGYVSDIKYITSEKTGGLKGLGHYIPIIHLDRIWNFNNLLTMLLYELKIEHNNNINLLSFKLFINISDFNNSNICDDNNGLTEDEYNYDKWVYIELK